MPEKPRPKDSRKAPILILAALVISIIGALLLNWNYIVDIISHDIMMAEKKRSQEQIAILEKEIEELTEKQPAAPTPEEQIKETTTAKNPPLDLKSADCQELDRRVQEFFIHLDDQEYIAAYRLEGGSHAHFKRMVDKLLTNPPIVVRETDSLFTILTNTAHFYRVLGKDNVFMLKDILAREEDSLEFNLALFDQWAKTGNLCENTETQIDLPLQGMYEYAGFFLNTLGGQSYLFRRDSNLRLLIKYYCILVLDRANAKILNRHGIDIVPPLESLIRELEVIETLTYKDQYLRQLRGLQEKYHVVYQ